MTYYTGNVQAVPTANKDAYRDHARQAWAMLQKAGATRMVECWGEDVPPGKHTDFLRAVQAQPDETVVFSWIEWPDKATSDAAWSEMSPEDMPEMPFDGKRMIFGGFVPLIFEGADRGGYFQGYLTPVPAANKDAYRDLALQSWKDMFAPNGALGALEAWGEDVPRGKQTDMYRAVDAQDDEVVVFAWTAWPDRATCDKAAEKMMQDMGDGPMPDMPFDGKRMIWGGFATLFDSAAS